MRRELHPVAWWVWALGLASAATATTNPFALLLIVGVASVVVAVPPSPTVTSTVALKKWPVINAFTSAFSSTWMEVGSSLLP